MQRTFPDMSESPWTHPDTGTIYEYADGMWRPQDPSGGGGSSGGGGGNLDLGGMIMAHHVLSADYNHPGRARNSGGCQRHKIDLFGWDVTDYDKLLIGSSYEVLTAPDKRTILSRYAAHENNSSNNGPCSGWGYGFHAAGANSVEGNFLYTWYKSSPWMVDLSDEEISNIISSYLDDPGSYQIKGPKQVHNI